MKMLIVGHGFVGKAVEQAFKTPNVEQIIVDPKEGTYLEDISSDEEFDVAFVCVPTPMSEEGTIDSRIVRSVVEDLSYMEVDLIVLKSTVLPHIVKEMEDFSYRFVYNPEFLTERNYVNDLLNAKFHIMGGKEKDTHDLATMYSEYSQCSHDGLNNIHFCTVEEASFIKYGINCYLASKIAWFNQLKIVLDHCNIDYDNVVGKGMLLDERISKSHTSVPGPDGRYGFGGACFTKDTNALYHATEGDLSILGEVIRSNNKIRSQYDLQDREREQGVSYDLNIETSES